MSKRHVDEKPLCPESPKRSNSQEQASPSENGDLYLDSGESGFQDNEVDSVDVPKDVDMPLQSPDSDSGESGFQDNEYMDDHVTEDVIPQSSVAGDSDSNSSNSDSDQEYPLEDVQMPFAADCMRPFAENVLHCNIKIGEEKAKHLKKQKKQKKQEKQKDCNNENSIQSCILEKCCAIYNAGGGVLEMRVVDFEDLDAPQNDLDRFWRTVEQQLKALIESLSYVDVFDRKFDLNSGTVNLFIKNVPNHFCTLKLNLFLAGDSGNYEASYNEAIHVMTKPLNLKKKRHSDVDAPLRSLPKVDEEFVYEKRVSFHESKEIQLKRYTSETILTNHNQCDKVRETISSFANANGGVIYLGIADKTGIAYGQNFEKDSTDAIEKKVQFLINKMYWSVTPKRGVHWDVTFLPLVGKENHYVVAIYVAGMQSSGGVFAKCPVSVELRPSEDGSEGQVHRLDFDEWQGRMVGGTDTLQTGSKGMEALISKFKHLKRAAPKYGPLMTVQDDVQEIRRAFFKVTSSWSVSPKGAEKNLPEDAQDFIRRFQEQLAKGRSSGCFVVSRSSAWCTDAGSVARPDGLICDLLLVSRDMGGLHLFALCEPGSEEDINGYSLASARALKKSLVLEGGCDEKFYISNCVVPCSTTTTTDDLCSVNTRYPKQYDLGYSREKLNEILEALVIILSKVPSSLSNSLGISFMNLLTEKQFQLVHEEIEHNRELWVKGAAGTGKTIVAVEFMRELFRRDEHLEKQEILCVCENKGIRKEIERADVCRSVCRKTFMDSREDYSNVKHVIMDEVQNFRDQDGDWLEKARGLVKASPDDPDGDPGYLWLFIDNSQLNHYHETGIPVEKNQKPHFLLSKVIRNSKYIFEYAKKYINNNAELGHDFPGDEVTHVTYSGGERPPLKALWKVLQSLLDEGYSKGDIVVLYGKWDCIPSDLKSTLNRGEISDATENHSKRLVVSTIRMYSGLGRPVVVLVNLRKSLPYRGIEDSFYYCGITRAMVKLVILEQQTSPA